MERVGAFEMDDRLFISCLVEPAFFLVSDLKDSLRRFVQVCPGGASAGADHFPIPFRSLEDHNSLGVLTDPDEVLGRAFVAF